VLPSFRKICDWKSLSRGWQPCLPEDLSRSRLIGIHVTIPVAAENKPARSRQRRRVGRRRCAMAPQDLPAPDIQSHEFTEIALRLRLLVISAPHGTRAASAIGFLDGAEGRFLAVQIERDVRGIRLRA